MKKVIIAGLLAFLVGFGATYYLMNKPHRDVAGEEATHQLTAEELYSAFESDEAVANTKYLDQVVLVSGTISSITQNDSNSSVIALMEGVACGMQMEEAEKISSLKENDQISIKGLCTGYDGILEVKMSKCTIQ